MLERQIHCSLEALIPGIHFFLRQPLQGFIHILNRQHTRSGQQLLVLPQGSHSLLFTSSFPEERLAK